MVRIRGGRRPDGPVLGRDGLAWRPLPKRPRWLRPTWPSRLRSSRPGGKRMRSSRDCCCRQSSESSSTAPADTNTAQIAASASDIERRRPALFPNISLNGY